jgi:hypothetical protein
MRAGDRDLFDALRAEAIGEPDTIDPMFLKALKPVRGCCDAHDPEDTPPCHGGVYQVLEWNDHEHRRYQLCLTHAFAWGQPNWHEPIPLLPYGPTCESSPGSGPR